MSEGNAKLRIYQQWDDFLHSGHTLPSVHLHRCASVLWTVEAQSVSLWPDNTTKYGHIRDLYVDPIQWHHSIATDIRLRSQHYSQDKGQGQCQCLHSMVGVRIQGPIKWVQKGSDMHTYWNGMKRYPVYCTDTWPTTNVLQHSHILLSRYIAGLDSEQDGMGRLYMRIATHHGDLSSQDLNPGKLSVDRIMRIQIESKMTVYRILHVKIRITHGTSRWIEQHTSNMSSEWVLGSQ